MLLVLLASAPVAAQPPRSEGPRPEMGPRNEPDKRVLPMPAVSTPQDKKPATLTLDALKLPARAVLVLYEEAKDALQLLPRLVVMTPKEYQDLQDQIDQLRRQLRADKPESPSLCKITGRIAGELAHLDVHFEFQTEARRTTIRLGCQKGWPISAKVDGKLPWLRQTEEGLVVVIDTAGKHEADLQLLVPIVTRRGPRGPERSLELDLPRTAMTMIERLDLPAGITEPKLGSRGLKPVRQADKTERIENVLVGPGPVDRLDLTWQPPRNEGVAAVTPVFGVTERIGVRVHDTEVATEAEITLRVLRGEMSRWRVRVPAPGASSAELKPVSQDEERVLAIDKKVDGDFVEWDVRSREPMGDAVRLVLQIRQPRPKARLGIGPILVADALTQRGELDVRAADDLRLFLQEAPGMSRRELTEEQRRDKVRASYLFGSAGAGQPLITLQMQEVKGALEVKTKQSLRLLENEKPKSPNWRVVTRIEATPLRTGVDYLELSLPAGYLYDQAVGAAPADLVEEVAPDPVTQRLIVKLAQRQSKPFSFTISGSYVLPNNNVHAANLELPCPLVWGDERSNSGQRTPILDRGGEVAALIPDTLELFDPTTGRSLSPQPVKGLGTFELLFKPNPTHQPIMGMREYSWNSDRIPKNLEVNWRTYRPEMPVDVVADVSLSAGRVRIRERLQFQFLQPPLPQVPLHTPGDVEIESVEGGTFVGDVDASGDRDLILQTPVGKLHTVTITYVASLPSPTEDQPRKVSLPLFQTSIATRGRTRVRIWSDANLNVTPASNEWTVGLPENVPDRDSMPGLVLNGELLDSLALNYQVMPGSKAAVFIDRVLVRATIMGDGAQVYRMRFLLQRLADHQLELEFPISLRPDRVEVLLGGKRLPITFMDGNGKVTEGGKWGRVAIDPELFRQAVILDVNFQIDAVRLEENSPWKVRFRPAELLNSVLLGQVRWQVDLVGDALPLLLGAGYVREQHWGWRGWLWGPRPGVSPAELDQWLQGGAPSPAALETSDPDLVCWKAAVDELRLVIMPQRFWLLACSLSLLLVCVAGVYLPLPQIVYGIALAALTVLIGVVGLFWPDLLPLTAFGCEPALLILGILLLVRLRLHHRYRQQMVFMPGFQQLKNGSSLTKKKDGSSLRRDLPTVESPPLKTTPVSPESSV
jgi:hypothetical protein